MLLGLERIRRAFPFKGFAEGKLEEMDWMSVHGWVGTGGAELGTNRTLPDAKGLDAIAAQIEKHRIDAVLTIGGWTGYRAVYEMARGRESRPALRIPMLCVPAAIDNNLPGTELSIGADTALNGIVSAVDRIKQSAVAWNRCFIVEVMGGYCGYLAVMSGLATGAERVYLHEEGVTMKDLQDDVARLKRGFSTGKRVGLLIRNEQASSVYNTDFLRRLFEEEGGDGFDARQSIQGHLQQGGDPTPSDRIQATRLTARAVVYFAEQAANQTADASFIGITEGRLQLFDIAELPRLMNSTCSRPREQWWMKLRPIARVLAQPAPSVVEPPV